MTALNRVMLQDHVIRTTMDSIIIAKQVIPWGKMALASILIFMGVAVGFFIGTVQ